MKYCPKCGTSTRDSSQFCNKCGFKFQVVSSGASLTPGMELQNNYRIERVLGEGGFGRAYIARQKNLNRLCVIKQMLIPPNTSLKDIQELQRVFEREAKLLVDLNQPGHQNIPDIYDFFSDPTGNFLVMKYIQGDNLEERLSQMGGKLPWLEAVKIAIQIASALEYMHGRKPPVLHRDVKPSNIILDATERAWLIDFGLSKAQPSIVGKGGATTAMGTPGYAPLEQWVKKAVPASDIFALAATLHHLVSGRDPRDTVTTINLPSLKKACNSFPKLRSIDSTLPGALEQLIENGLVESPGKRPSATQWLKGLLALDAPQRVAVAGAQPFCFETGELAHGVTELFQLCDRRWEAGKRHLFQGDFENWLVQQLNEHGLASQAQAIRRVERDQDAALERFLRVLNPNLPPLPLSLSPTRVQFSKVGHDRPKPQQLTLTFVGTRGYLAASVVTTQSWIEIKPKGQIKMRPGNKQTFQVMVNPSSLSMGISSGDIIVKPQGQPEIRAKVRVRRSIFQLLVTKIFSLYNQIPSGVYFVFSLALVGGLAWWLMPPNWAYYVIKSGTGLPLDMFISRFERLWLDWLTELLPMLALPTALGTVLGLGREGRKTWKSNAKYVLGAVFSGIVFGFMGLGLTWFGWLSLVPELGSSLSTQNMEYVLLGLSTMALTLSTLYGVSQSGIDKVGGFVTTLARFVWGLAKFIFWIAVLAMGGWMGYQVVLAFDVDPDSLPFYAGIGVGALVSVSIVRGLIGFIRDRLN